MSYLSTQVTNLVKKIPRGCVSTYKEIAHAVDSRAYRAVGAALRGNTKPIIVPCHRVVNSDGSLGGYFGKMNSSLKIKLLKKEGVCVVYGKIVDFEKKMFKFIDD